MIRKCYFFQLFDCDKKMVIASGTISGRFWHSGEYLYDSLKKSLKAELERTGEDVIVYDFRRLK